MAESEDDFLILIGQLALDSHKSGSEVLSRDLPTAKPWPSAAKITADYRIEDNTVHFASLEARNRVVAAHTFREKRKTLASDAAEWLNVARDLWQHEIRSDDSAAGRLMALVHETNDIFAIATSSINSKDVDVFDALLAVECALPYLQDLSPKTICELSDAQYELTKSDMAAGVFFGKLGTTLVRFPDVCREIHHRLRTDTTDGAASLYPTVVVALGRCSPKEAVRLGLNDTDSANSLLRSIAVWTLGRLIALSLVAEDTLIEASDAIASNMSNTVEDVRLAAVRTAAGATPVTDVFVERLTELGMSGDQFAVGAIAEVLWTNLAEMKGKAYFGDWLRLLCKLPSDAAILDRYDHVLSRLLHDPSQQQLALSCLTEWVTVNGKEAHRDTSIAKLFDLVAIELAKRPELLSQVITKWCLSAGKRLPNAASGLLSHLGMHGLKKPEFDIVILDTLERDELLFLARRLLGFVFSEDHLLSLSMSFFKTVDAPQRTFGLLRSLLVDELGYDYPHSTIEALDSVMSTEANSEIKTFCSNTIEAIRNRMTVLNDLPRLTELNPPPNLQRQFIKARDKQMRKAMEEAQKGSIIRQMVTGVPIKAGIGYFSFRDGHYSEPAYLKSISHSATLPRRSTIDAVGQEMSIWGLRNAEREEP